MYPNRLEVPVQTTDDSVLGILERELLTPDFVNTMVPKVLTRAAVPDHELEETRSRLMAELSTFNSELVNLPEALAASGTSKTLTTALKDRECRQAHVEDELAGLGRRRLVSEMELDRLEAAAREKVGEWRALLHRHTPQARQILQKMLREKLVFRQELQDGMLGYRFSGDATITHLLEGAVPNSSQAVASPTGHTLMWKPEIKEKAAVAV